MVLVNLVIVIMGVLVVGREVAARVDLVQLPAR
jgi:hypothetical protein